MPHLILGTTHGKRGNKSARHFPTDTTANDLDRNTPGTTRPKGKPNLNGAVLLHETTLHDKRANQKWTLTWTKTSLAVHLQRNQIAWTANKPRIKRITVSTHSNALDAENACYLRSHARWCERYWPHHLGSGEKSQTGRLSLTVVA